MPKTRPAYPEQFRREALELVRRGRSIPDVAESLGVSQQTLRNWRRQGERPRRARRRTDQRRARGAARAA
jgi:transposase